MSDTRTYGQNKDEEGQIAETFEPDELSPDVIVHDPNSRYFLDECEGGYILLDWNELDPPEGSPDAVELSNAEVWESIRQRYGFPPGTFSCA